MINAGGWHEELKSKTRLLFTNFTLINRSIDYLVAIRENTMLNVTASLTPPAFEKLESVIKEHQEFGMENKHGAILSASTFQCSLTVNEKKARDVLLRFIAFLSQFDQSINKIIPSIKRHLRYYNIKEIHKQISEKLQNSGIDAALKFASLYENLGYKDVYYALASFCIEKKYYNEAKEAINAINTKDSLEQIKAAELCLSAANKIREEELTKNA
ncbi:MAG: hypothetical protein JWM09_1211 [Francisellaceae bacterium]|nr:hypothetical protein [Francisellaceae bacterium]